MKTSCYVYVDGNYVRTVKGIILQIRIRKALKNNKTKMA
jgi:hypothetical protein